MILTAEQILAAADLERLEVEVPEWGPGAKVLVRMMTAAERSEYWEPLRGYLEGKKEDAAQKHLASARLVAFTACNEQGERLFTIEHVEALGRKSTVPIERVAMKAWNLNQLGAAARKRVAGN